MIAGIPLRIRPSPSFGEQMVESCGEIREFEYEAGRKGADWSDSLPIDQ